MRKTFVMSVVCLVGFVASPLFADGKGSEIDGAWKLTKYIESGKPNEEDVKANYRVLRKDGIQEITKDGKSFSKAKFEIDPSKSPKQITFTDDNGARFGGIYDVNGETMRVAILSDSEKRKTDRPTDFKEEGKIIAVYERVKE